MYYFDKFMRFVVRGYLKYEKITEAINENIIMVSCGALANVCLLHYLVNSNHSDITTKSIMLMTAIGTPILMINLNDYKKWLCVGFGLPSQGIIVGSVIESL